MTTHALYEVGTVPTKITPDGTHSGMDITIQNVNLLKAIYVGGVDVSPTNFGYKILPNHAISFELSGMDDLYLVAEEDGLSAAVLKVKLEVGQ